MRALALLGGAAMLGSVVAWHWRDETGEVGTACSQAKANPWCAAMRGLTETLRGLPSISASGRLPPSDVLGAIDPTVTQDNIDETICRPGYARLRRPSYAITGPLKRRMMTAQYPGSPMSAYELDHLIPISLGGAPLSARDLWLQPREGQANAADKNVLAYVLWRLVCERRLALSTAQTAIRSNWIEAYDRYATPANIARYHFRHASERERDR